MAEAPADRTRPYAALPSARALLAALLALAAPPAPAQEAGGGVPRLFAAGLPVDPGPVPAGLAGIAAQVCSACHYAVHDGWAGSAHRGAGTNRLLEEAARASGEAPACRSCHLPLRVQHREVLAAVPEGEAGEPVLEPNPAWRPSLAAEGVTCAACHVRDGTVLGPYGRNPAPHPVTVTRELADPALCATCHQLTWKGAEAAIYDTFGEWQRSPWSQAGVRCQDCHMAPRPGAATQGRFAAVADHAVRADLARALTLELLLPPEGAVRGTTLHGELQVANTGAGHAVPTGSPFKAVRIEVRLLDGAGREVGDPAVLTLRRSVDPEPPHAVTSDDRLQPGERRTLPLAFAVPHRAAPGEATVRVEVCRVDAAGKAGEPELVREHLLPLQ